MSAACRAALPVNFSCISSALQAGGIFACRFPRALPWAKASRAFGAGSWSQCASARALVLDDGTTRVAIGVVDSCMVAREELDKGYNGYLPPPEQFPLGGYTTGRARTSYLETLQKTRTANPSQ